MSSMRGAIRIAALVLVLVVPVLVSSPLGTSAASPQGSVVVRSVWSRALGHIPCARSSDLPRRPTEPGGAAPAHALPPRTARRERRDGLFALGVQASARQPDRQRGVAPAMIVVAPEWTGRGPTATPSGTTPSPMRAPAGARSSTRDLVQAIDAAYATKHGRALARDRGHLDGRLRGDQSRARSLGHVRHRLELVAVLRRPSRPERATGRTSSATWSGALAAALGRPSRARAQAPADRDVVLLAPDRPLLRRERVVQQDAHGAAASRTASALSPAGTTPRSGAPRWRPS